MLLTVFSPLNLFFQNRFSFRAKGFSVRPRVSVTLLLSCLVTYQHTVLNVVVGYVYKVPLRKLILLLKVSFGVHSSFFVLSILSNIIINVICFKKKQKNINHFIKVLAIPTYFRHVSRHLRLKFNFLPVWFFKY